MINVFKKIQSNNWITHCFLS